MTNDAEQTAPVSILAIDDEPQILRLLTIALETDGYRVTGALKGAAGVAQASQHRYDLVILDLGLPDLPGAEVLKRLRSWSQVPVIILTVQEGEAEKIEALDGGADDYVTKPFNTGELLARIRATLRRSQRGAVENPVFRLRDLEVELHKRRVNKGGQLVKLTATEYALLRLFVQHPGRVFTHRQILREVWGPEHERQTQYLRVYMGRLREKLEGDSTDAPLFLTEPGVGYRLADS